MADKMSSLYAILLAEFLAIFLSVLVIFLVLKTCSFCYEFS
jgi:hypothetical protein